MEEMIEQPIKVFVKVNDKNEITAVGSSVFIQDTNGWVEVDSGFGDKYTHAQSQYFNKPIIDDNGQYSYTFTDGVIEEKNK